MAFVVNSVMSVVDDVLKFLHRIQVLCSMCLWMLFECIVSLSLLQKQFLRRNSTLEDSKYRQ